MEIKYFNRENGEVETEKVYGDKAVRWLYDTTPGKLLSRVLIKKPLSKFYGVTQSSRLSKRKVEPFIRDFGINKEDFLPDEGREDHDPYATFNNFFIRRFRPGKREFASEPSVMPAFCEARYFGYDSLTEESVIPVKGNLWNGRALLQRDKWGDLFTDGPCLLARLCPVDYHRFHFPDDGEILDYYRLPGLLHSVNPLALSRVPEVFSVNERQVTIIDTKNFGKLAYVEVGAICVGKIAQSREMAGQCRRGEEKGYFLFGGSTVIVLGEAGKWKPDDVILEKTNNAMEVYQKLGTPIAHKI